MLSVLALCAKADEVSLRLGGKEIELLVQAAEFYRGHGFVADGKVFKEAGLLVQKMRMGL